MHLRFFMIVFKGLLPFLIGTETQIRHTLTRFCEGYRKYLGSMMSTLRGIPPSAS